MRINVVLSSSSGNSTILQSENEQLLIDAGGSLKTIRENYKYELKPNAIFITHAHIDHVAAAGVIGRKFKIPIYITKEAADMKSKIFENCDLRYINSLDEIELQDYNVEVILTKHDAPGSVAYIFNEKKTKNKFGYLTDTGVITKLVKEKLYNCNILFMESDYDTEMLRNCDEYDEILKTRISGPFGHLSNQDVIEYFKNRDLKCLDKIIFGHLSKHTNSPETLQEQLKNNFSEYIDKFIIANEQVEIVV